MNILFLRGAVPPANEHPEKLEYEGIEACEDVWTQLFYFLLKELNASGELLYQGAQEKVAWQDSFFKEKHVASLAHYTPAFKPDLIIARGGFDYYDKLIKRYPDTKKIYYGAGTRYYPKGYSDYDLFLVYSPIQKEHITKKQSKHAALFIKPAAGLFSRYTQEKTEKEYDICFMANASQKQIKRHTLLIDQLSGTDYSVLALGNTDPDIIRYAKNKKVNIHWGGWSLRKHLPEKISKCRIGVVCSSNYDSCPRVIPEYLACGLPVVASSNMHFWQEKYISPETGVLIDENKLLSGIEQALAIQNCAKVAGYYRDNLSLSAAAQYLKMLVERILRF